MIFSKDELRDIIYDLRKNYYDDNIYLKSINEIRKQQKEKNFKNLIEPQINKDEIERGIYSGKRRFKQNYKISVCLASAIKSKASFILSDGSETGLSPAEFSTQSLSQAG